MLYICYMGEEINRPPNISLRRKIAERCTEKIEYDYCYLHDEHYVVVDSSYVFNRCGHDSYYANLQVAAAKIKMLNEDASYDSIVEGLKYVMFNAAKTVYYPTVTLSEAESIVSSIWNVNPDKVERFVYGDDVVNADWYDESRQYNNVYSYRLIEWKPNVAELITLTEGEKEEYNSITDKVKAHNYLLSAKISKKTSYSSKVRHELERMTIDAIVHSVKQSLDEEAHGQIVTREMLFNNVLRQADISEYMFLQSLKRLRGTGCINTDYAPNKTEEMVRDSEEKIIKAGYQIHYDKEIINKFKVHKRTSMSKRTINKRWDAVEPTFKQLNSLLTNN